MAKKQQQDNQDSIWLLVKLPNEKVRGARLVICELLRKAPGRRMKRSKLAGLVAKAKCTDQDANYLLSLKKKFLVDGGFVAVR